MRPSFIRRERGSYGLVEMLAWSYQLASALQALWTAKIYHGDIKVKNILVDHQGKVLISDFGVSPLTATNGTQHLILSLSSCSL